MKKPNLHVFLGLLFSLLLLSYFSASALLLQSKQDEKEANAIDVAHARSSTELAYDMQLMDSEECDEEDEECCVRRMTVEAHLDYIYTQHHKPAYKHKP